MPSNQNDNQIIDETGRKNPSLPMSPKMIIFIVAFLSIWAAVVFAVWYVNNNQPPPKLRGDFSAKTEGEIIKMEFYECGRGDCADISRVNYKFSVNGTVYQRSFSAKNKDYRDKFPANKLTTVCYDPHSPDDSYLLEQYDEKECGR